ncbi:PREDICTED: uncharacterized protein LOC109153584 [Ipomoea nil]|uniref:uncharacterized protein LOC109153584 n=1 Tax=Ipomoea nil TaxID=35883 RepID=UPI00090190EF|nr:PREDICTED: uncharacterized protein LOC109153584 [Ipomoea nil]
MDMVQKRLADEKNSGGYGRGKVLDRVRKSVAEIENNIVGDGVEAQAVGDKAKMSDVEKISMGMKKLTAAIVEFGEVMTEVGSKNTGQEIIKKTFSKMSDMLNIASTSQPDKTSTLLDDDPIFSSESFLAAVASLEKAAMEALEKATTITEEPVDPETFSPPRFNLLTPTPPDIQKPNETTTTLPGEERSTEKEQTLFDIALEESERENVQHGEREKRKLKNVPLRLRSPYWTKNNEKLSFVSAKEKMLSDFAFMEPSIQHPIDETLFRYKRYHIARDQFLTLRDGEVEKTIIDVWSLRMNSENITRGMGEPKCIYFTTNPFMEIDDATEWKIEFSAEEKQRRFNGSLDYEIKLASNIDISDAELVFFPVIRYHHYFIMCLNFKKRVVQVVDNRTLGKNTNFLQRYDNCDQNLVNAFKEYCKFKRITTLLNKMTKHDDEDDVFNHELVKMSWKNATNVTDCGVYCMRHMQTFKGNGPNWESGFNRTPANAIFLTSLRAKYAADILFLPMNEHKQSILQAAQIGRIKKGILNKYNVLVE